MKNSNIITKSVAGLLIAAVLLCVFGCSKTSISRKDVDRAFREASKEYGLEDLDWESIYDSDTRKLGYSIILFSRTKKIAKNIVICFAIFGKLKPVKKRASIVLLMCLIIALRLYTRMELRLYGLPKSSVKLLRCFHISIKNWV